MDHWKRMRVDPSGQSQREPARTSPALGVDVVVVKEAAPSPFVDRQTWLVRTHSAQDKMDAWLMHSRHWRWGTAVVVSSPALEFEPIGSAQLNGPCLDGMAGA